MIFFSPKVMVLSPSTIDERESPITTPKDTAMDKRI